MALQHSRELDGIAETNIYDQTRSYHSIDGKLSVVNRHIGISGVSDESHSGRHQVYQENWYDALGRRVLVRARKSSACNNGTHGDLACKSYVERTIWDGDQILIEKRMDGASGLSSSALDYGSGGSSGAWGDVLSVHAHGIDQPVAVRKPGHTSIAPHANWMGDYEIGTTAAGTVTTSCNGASNCPLILWPGSRQTVDGQLVSHSAINTWWGSLITEKTDPSGYKYMRNRYYNPQTGQFTQQDPIGLAGGVNLYGFADGDPVNFDDPFGLCPPCYPGMTGMRPLDEGNPIKAFAILGGITVGAIAVMAVPEATAVAARWMVGGSAASAAVTRVPFSGFQEWGREAVKWGSRAEGAAKRAAEITVEEASRLDPGKVQKALDFYKKRVDAGRGGAAAPERVRLMQRIRELQQQNH